MNGLAGAVGRPIISFDHVTKVFRNERREVRAVDDVTLDVRAGEIFGVIGHSGAGKSTLVRLVNALEPVTSGNVVVDGTSVTGLSEAKLRHVRTGIGMVFQHVNLLNSRTVAKNVEYPLRIVGRPRAERAERVAELLDFVGIGDKADALPGRLSGGQRQRVGIARALATNPPILLADEATSALDPETTQGVLDLLRRVNRELGVSIMVITHEMDVVRQVCHRVAVMDRGRVVELGDAYRVFCAPEHEVTRRFARTALGDRPGPETLARLRARHRGRIVTVSVDDGSSARLTRVLRAHDVDWTVVFGGILEVAERPCGSLTLELVGADDAVEASVRGLRALADVIDHAAQSPSGGRALASGGQVVESGGQVVA